MWEEERLAPPSVWWSWWVWVWVWEGCRRVFREPLGDTVDSCSWISIMWSPKRMVRLSGALPVRKSLTWKMCTSELGTGNGGGG